MSSYHPDMLPAIGEAYRRGVLAEADRRRLVAPVRRPGLMRRLILRSAP